MEKQKVQNMAIALAIIVILVSGFGTAAFAQTNDVKANDTNSDQKIIDVTGTYTVSGDPDKAEIYMGFEANRETAQEAQTEVANKMASIRAALALKGVSSSDIETVQYDVSPNYDCVDGQSIPRGYTAIQMIKVKTTDISEVGSLVDAASGAGANKIESIQFGLSDAKTEELKKQALTEAAKSARGQADAIATGLGARIIGAEKASTTYDYQPYPLYGGAVMAETTTKAIAPTQIDASQVKVSATVQVTFSFE
jgi:uncharacterized protein YggE